MNYKICMLGKNSVNAYLAEKFSKLDNVEKVFLLFEQDLSEGAVEKNNSKIEYYRKEIFDDTYQHDLLTVKNKQPDIYIPTLLGYVLGINLFRKLGLIHESSTWLGPKTVKGGILELSKIETKKIFNELNITTPKSIVISRHQLLDSFADLKRPFVLKFDKDFRDGRQSLIVTDENFKEIYDNDLVLKVDRTSDLLNVGPHTEYLIEKFIPAKYEYSLHIICQADKWMFIGSARDYKKEHTGDTGQNVSSQGCYSLSEKVVDPDLSKSIDKLLKYLTDQGQPYYGIMYLGILVDENNVHQILEINSRPGNPEFISIVETIDENILDLLIEGYTNNTGRQVKFKQGTAVTINISNFNLDSSKKDSNIKFPKISHNDFPDDINFAYGNTVNRFCSLTTIKPTKEEAAKYIFSYLEGKDLGDYSYRRDIGFMP